VSTSNILKVLETEMYRSETTKMEIDRGHPFVGLASMLARAALIDFLKKLEPRRFKKIEVFL
jgi:hypothetical protein